MFSLLVQLSRKSGAERTRSLLASKYLHVAQPEAERMHPLLASKYLHVAQPEAELMHPLLASKYLHVAQLEAERMHPLLAAKYLHVAQPEAELMHPLLAAKCLHVAQLEAERIPAEQLRVEPAQAERKQPRQATSPCRPVTADESCPRVQMQSESAAPRRHWRLTVQNEPAAHLREELTPAERLRAEQVQEERAHSLPAEKSLPAAQLRVERIPEEWLRAELAVARVRRTDRTPRPGAPA